MLRVAVHLFALVFALSFLFLVNLTFANMGESRSMWLMDSLGVEHTGRPGCYHR